MPRCSSARNSSDKPILPVVAKSRKRDIAAIIRQKKGVLADISFGGTPQPNAVTIGPKGDIPLDPAFLWNAYETQELPDGFIHTAVVTHVLEYVHQDCFFQWWNGLHRLMQPNGIVYVSGPYGGDESQGWLSDPCHMTRVVEQSFAWLDPRTPFYALHESVGRPQPKPWHPQNLARVPGTHGTVSYNVVLQAVKS